MCQIDNFERKQNRKKENYEKRKKQERKSIFWKYFLYKLDKQIMFVFRKQLTLNGFICDKVIAQEEL